MIELNPKKWDIRIGGRGNNVPTAIVRCGTKERHGMASDPVIKKIPLDTLIKLFRGEYFVDAVAAANEKLKITDKTGNVVG